MEYEKSGSKKISKSSAVNETIKNVDTKAIVWALIKRHKFALVSIYAVLITVVYAMPFLPGEVVSLLSR